MKNPRLNGSIAALAATVGLLFATPSPAGATNVGDPGRIVIEASDDLYSIDKEGNDVQQLTDTGTGVREFDPAWSPDGGARIAFAHTGDIWLMDADGSNVRRLTEGSGRYESPAWSPDGESLVFVHTDLGVGTLYTMRVPDEPTEPTHRVPTRRRNVRSATWSPTGFKIFFATDNPEDPYSQRVWSINAHASSATQEFVAMGKTPDLSPDGSRLLVGRGHTYGTVWRMKKDGSNTVRLASDYSGGTYIHPAWSPSGHRILWTYSGDTSGDPCGLRSASPSGKNEKIVFDPCYQDLEYGAVSDSDWQPLCLPLSAPHGTSARRIGCGDDHANSRSLPPGSFFGFGGADSLKSKGRGSVVINGGTGDDELVGDVDSDRRRGFRDWIVDLSGEDVLRGGKGRDFLDAQDGIGGDTLFGGQGNDLCHADSGDTLKSC